MKQHKKGLALWLAAILLLLAGALLTGSPGRTETVQEAMRDAVLHDVNRISLFGLKEVNPGLISAFIVTLFLLLAAVCIRIFFIPRFQYRPGKLQLLLEKKGQIVSRDAMMTALWESDSFVDENTLSVNVNRLRRKLEAAGLPDFIRTRKGAGYLVEESGV